MFMSFMITCFIIQVFHYSIFTSEVDACYMGKHAAYPILSACLCVKSHRYPLSFFHNNTPYWQIKIKIHCTYYWQRASYEYPCNVNGSWIGPKKEVYFRLVNWLFSNFLRNLCCFLCRICTPYILFVSCFVPIPVYSDEFSPHAPLPSPFQACLLALKVAYFYPFLNILKKSHIYLHYHLDLAMVLLCKCVGK